MRTIDDVIEELRVDAQRAIEEHPDKAGLDPLVSMETALREYYQFVDEIGQRALTDDEHFRMGQHISRISLCAVMEATAQFPVTREARILAVVRYTERVKYAMRNVRSSLGYKV